MGLWRSEKFFLYQENSVFPWNFLWVNYKEVPHTQKGSEESYSRDPRGLPIESLSELAWATVSVHLVVPELFKHVDSLCITKSREKSSASCCNSSSISFPQQFMIFLISHLMTSLPIFCFVLPFRFYGQIYISR